VSAKLDCAERPRLRDFLVAAGVVPDVDVSASAGAVGAGVGADYLGVGGGGCCRQGEGEGLGELHGEENVVVVYVKVLIGSRGCVGSVVSGEKERLWVIRTDERGENPQAFIPGASTALYPATLSQSPATNVFCFWRSNLGSLTCEAVAGWSRRVARQAWREPATTLFRTLMWRVYLDAQTRVDWSDGCSQRNMPCTMATSQEPSRL
jgi:hypothetical protein